MSGVGHSGGAGFSLQRDFSPASSTSAGKLTPDAQSQLQPFDPQDNPATVRLTRRYRFAASHRLHSPQLSEEENCALYGKCNNPYGHGHNYIVEVTIHGPVDPISGRAVDLESLDSLVQGTIVKQFDHRNLNQDVAEFMGALVPTTENLAAIVQSRLSAAWPSGLPPLDRVRIFETRNNIFEIKHS
jgi:6-pyruvoyltetrahydropterin/6-carboxytetrahydropterin synthase